MLLLLLSTSSSSLVVVFSTMEMRCFHKLLGISHRDRIANREVNTRTENAIGLHEDFLTSVKRHKLKWYGHVARSSGLDNTALQYKEGDEEADGENDGKTVSESGLALNGTSYCGTIVVVVVVVVVVVNNNSNNDDLITTTVVVIVVAVEIVVVMMMI